MIRAGDFVRWVSPHDGHPTGPSSAPRWKIGIVSGDDPRKDPIPVIQLQSSEDDCSGQGCLFTFPAKDLTLLDGWLSIGIQRKVD